MSSQYHLGKGLHDAEVMKINEIQLLYDYHEKIHAGIIWKSN